MPERASGLKFQATILKVHPHNVKNGEKEDKGRVKKRKRGRNGDGTGRKEGGI